MHILVFIALFSFAGASYVSNVPSNVIELNDKFIDVKDKGHWFIKFYAPWCAHCKRLNPVWEHVAHAMKDKDAAVRVGSMDCTRFPPACNSLSIHGYPTLIYFRNGEQFVYEGEREKEFMVDFALKCAAPTVAAIQNLVQFNELREGSHREPVFILVQNEKAENVEALDTSFDHSAHKLFTRTRFFSMPPSLAASALPVDHRVFVLREKKIEPFTGGAGDELHRWVLGERWPLVARASAASIGQLGGSDKLLVLLVVHQIERYNQSTESGIFYAEAIEAAREARNDPLLKSAFQFAWLDGNSIVNSITIGHMDVPGYLVLNYSSYEFYLPLDSPQKVTRQGLQLWLHSVLKGEIIPGGGRGITTRIYRIAYELFTNVRQMFVTQPLLSCCIFGVPLAFFSIIMYTLCSNDYSVDREEIYPDEDEEGDEEDYEDRAEEEDTDHEKAE